MYKMLKGNMWKKMKEESWISSFKLLFSYLFILIAPVMAIILVYFRAADAMLEIQYNNANSSLENMAVAFEQQMKEIHNVSIYVGTNSQLNHLISREYEKREEFYMMYEFARELPDYHATNQMIQYLYVFLQNKNYIIRGSTVVPAVEIGYQTVRHFGGYDYEELMEILCGRYYYGKVLFLGKEGEPKSMVMVQSVPYQITAGRVEGSIAVIFSEEQIKELFRAACVDETAGLFLVDKEGSVLKGYSDGEWMGTVSSIEGLTLEDGYSVYQKDGISYLACVKRSEQQGWYYVTLTKNELFLRSIRSIKYVMNICCVLAVMVGCAICFYYWMKRHGVMMQYYRMQKEWGICSGEVKRLRGYGFWNELHHFFEQVSELQKTLALQGDRMKPAVMRKLLYGEYTTEVELLQDLSYAQMDLEVKKGHVVVLSFEDVMENKQFSSINEFRLFMRNFLHESIPYHFFLYEMSSTTCVLILCDKRSAGEEEIKNPLQRMQWMLKEKYKLNVYIGMGESQREWILISQDFLDAQECAEYAKYYQISIPISTKELPEKSEIFYFPVDLEMKLVHTVKRGTKEELLQIQEEIRTNFEERRLSVSMVDHLLNLIRSAIIRVLEDLPDKESIHELTKKLEEGSSLNEIFEQIFIIQQMNTDSVIKENEKKNEKFVEQIQQEMEEGFCDLNFTLGVLADHIGMSESKLYKKFKICMGCSFSELLEKMRIDHACDLLRKKLPVKEVAVECGYSSDYSFRRAFKRVMGMAPTDYMKSIE